jgi:hypothetical protein
VPPEGIRVDCLLLADGALVSNGKLYIHGGGWNFLNFRDRDAARTIHVAGRIIVPWSKSEGELFFQLHLEHIVEGSVSVLAPILQLKLRQRPHTGKSEGPETATPFAFDMGAVSFSHPGEYAYVVTHDGEELARTRFQVNFVKAPPAVEHDDEYRALVKQVNDSGWGLAEAHYSDVGVTLVFRRTSDSDLFSDMEEVVTGGDTEKDALRQFLGAQTMERLHQERRRAVETP